MDIMPSLGPREDARGQHRRAVVVGGGGALPEGERWSQQMTVTPVPPRGVRQRTDDRAGARPIYIGGVDAGSSPQPEPRLCRSVGWEHARPRSVRHLNTHHSRGGTGDTRRQLRPHVLHYTPSVPPRKIYCIYVSPTPMILNCSLRWMRLGKWRSAQPVDGWPSCFSLQPLRSRE